MRHSSLDTSRVSGGAGRAPLRLGSAGLKTCRGRVERNRSPEDQLCVALVTSVSAIKKPRGNSTQCTGISFDGFG